jgi:ribose-phosphate pyrophosphokinase
MRELKLLTGRSHPKLAEDIAEYLGIQLCDVSLSNFANGEISFRLNESIRGNDVFILQAHSESDAGGSINDSILEQAIMIDAAKRSSAASITAICPFLGYARQDRKAGGREPITGRLVVDLFAAAGADRIMSVDLHAGQIQGFFNGPFDHLIARPTLVKQFQAELKDEDFVIVSPDAGRGKSAERFSSDLNCGMAIIHKHRSTSEHNTVEARYLMGEVENKTCIVIDDMIDTAGTLCAAADLLMEKGAKQVYGVATHGVLSHPAMERIDDSAFKKLFITDTVPLPKHRSAKLEVVSIAPLLGDAIRAIYEQSSVSALFGGQNQL